MSDGRRRLVLDDGVWRYRVRNNLLEIWTPGGRRVERGINQVYNAEWISSCSEGEGHRFPITPGILRSYIEANRETL